MLKQRVFEGTRVPSRTQAAANIEVSSSCTHVGISSHVHVQVETTPTLVARQYNSGEMNNLGLSCGEKTSNKRAEHLISSSEG